MKSRLSGSNLLAYAMYGLGKDGRGTRWSWAGSPTHRQSPHFGGRLLILGVCSYDHKVRLGLFTFDLGITLRLRPRCPRRAVEFLPAPVQIHGAAGGRGLAARSYAVSFASHRLSNTVAQCRSR